MFDNLAGSIVMGIARHAITSIAGGFVAQGLINNDQQQTLVAGGMVLVGIVLSIYNKGQQAQKGQ